MRFMMIVKASKEFESGQMPSDELIAAMGKYNEELMRAGVLVDLAGLQPSSKGARIRFSGGKKTLIDGPFVETKEMIGGFWIIKVKSKQEAIDWAMRAPAPHGEGKYAEIEIRQIMGLEEFVPSKAIDRERELAKEFAAKKG